MNIRSKEIAQEISRKEIEINNIEKFIQTTQSDDISVNQVLALFEKTKIEVNELLVKTLEEVENFHQTVYAERKSYLEQQRGKIAQERSILQRELEEINEKLDDIGAAISKNESYQEALRLYELYNNELRDLKYKEGVLSENKKLYEDLKLEDEKFTEYHNEIKNTLLQNYTNTITEYRDFIYDVVQQLYGDDIQAFFNVEIAQLDKRKKPIVVDLSLSGDTGEGVGRVRNLLIDILIFKFNTLLDLLILDSSCFNGIDPRQTFNIIKIIDSIARDKNKQAIISLNKYQIYQDAESEEFINEHTVLELSEENYLLGFSF